MKTISKVGLALSVLFVAGCMSMNLSKVKSSYIPIPETSKTVDIPKYDDTKHGLYG